jgi:hypothetical protein
MIANTLKWIPYLIALVIGFMMNEYGVDPAYIWGIGSLGGLVTGINLKT